MSIDCLPAAALTARAIYAGVMHDGLCFDFAVRPKDIAWTCGRSATSEPQVPTSLKLRTQRKVSVNFPVCTEATCLWYAVGTRERHHAYVSHIFPKGLPVDIMRRCERPHFALKIRMDLLALLVGEEHRAASCRLHSDYQIIKR